MIGTICTWDVLLHPLVTIQCFGWRIYLRALTRPKRTFLSLLSDNAFFGTAASEESGIVKECIKLELRAKQLYLSLARATTASRSLALFFTSLAQQEQDHADLLEICAAASGATGWRLHDLVAWHDNLIRLDQEMCAAESRASSISDVNNMMRLVVQIESSEVNHVFLEVMAGSKSGFVKKLRPFRCAIELHLSYIATRISELAPDLWPHLPRSGLFCSRVVE
jgi:hypothetical protein